MAEKPELEAFRAFDFDSHAGWQAYRNNLEVPPGREALLDKFKAKWYKREIDPDFDVDLVKPAAPPAPPVAEAGAAPRRPAPSSYVPPTQPAQPARQDAPQPPPQAAGNAVQAGQAGQLVVLVAHVMLVLSALVALQPFNKYLGWQAVFMFARTALVANGYRLYLRFGLPALRPFPAAVAPWLQQVALSTEFFRFMLATLMLQAPQLWMAVVPLGLAAAFPALDALGARFGGHPLWQRYGRPAQAALKANESAVLRFNATSEIAIGFQLALGVLAAGLRGAMLAWVYWNQLRMRYWAPESRPYHLEAWTSVAARVQPLLAAVPALQRYLDIAVRWFQAPGQQQHAHGQ